MPSARRSTQLLLLLLAISCACRKRLDGPPGDIVAALAPLPTADDSAFDAQSLRGKPTLVMFASPTCGHCIAEMPIAQKAVAAEQANLVAVFVVGAKRHAASVAKSTGFTAPVLVDEQGTLRKQYGIKGVPYLVVLGADGRAREAFRGRQEEDTLREALADAR
jgi:thiol-disulfide isomerase/thioredoxin